MSKDRLCPCGCGLLCETYYQGDRFKGYSRFAKNCIRPKHGPCPSKGKKGKLNINYKPPGSKRLHNSGRGLFYYFIKTSETEWKFEHRHIMENHLGRPLLETEVVHHIDGNTLNNDIENLSLMGKGEHTRKHHQIDSWSKNYNSCVSCGTTKKRHLSFGLCTTCYQRDRAQKLGFWP